MFGIADFPAFAAAIWLFMMVPGPGNLVIASSAAQGQVRGGMAATLGIIAGDQIVIWCALVGVAALLHAYPAAFVVVQWLGAIYLAWLGVRLWRKSKKDEGGVSVRREGYFRQAFLITLLNPKSIVFYVAFLPLFIDPVRHQGMATFGAMALTVALLGLLYGLIATLVVRQFAVRLAGNRYVAMLARRLTSVFLIGFGLRLALES